MRLLFSAQNWWLQIKTWHQKRRWWSSLSAFSLTFTRPNQSRQQKTTTTTKESVALEDNGSLAVCESSSRIDCWNRFAMGIQVIRDNTQSDAKCILPLFFKLPFLSDAISELLLLNVVFFKSLLQPNRWMQISINRSAALSPHPSFYNLHRRSASVSRLMAPEYHSSQHCPLQYFPRVGSLLPSSRHFLGLRDPTPGLKIEAGKAVFWMA